VKIIEISINHYLHVFKAIFSAILYLWIRKKPVKNLVSVILKVFVGSDGNWTIHKTDK